MVPLKNNYFILPLIPMISIKCTLKVIKSRSLHETLEKNLVIDDYKICDLHIE